MWLLYIGLQVLRLFYIQYYRKNYFSTSCNKNVGFQFCCSILGMASQTCRHLCLLFNIAFLCYFLIDQLLFAAYIFKHFGLLNPLSTWCSLHSNRKINVHIYLYIKHSPAIPWENCTLRVCSFVFTLGDEC